MHATENLTEADRLMTVCNSCRYCEGLCAVFPAMEARRAFEDADLNYLANLCHGCGACYIDCQFSPPHEFDVNVPKVLATVRADSYRAWAWPAAFRPVFDRNGLALSLIAAFSVAAFVLCIALWNDPDVLFDNSGAFYRLMPHTSLVVIFGGVSLYTVAALLMGFRNFWRETRMSDALLQAGSVWQAVKDTTALRYLDGGGGGCYNEADTGTDHRRLFHHLTFYGFMLCFASTTAGAFYHYFLAMPAPYPWYQLPKLLGIVGGIALIIGTAGLFIAKRQREPILLDRRRLGMDVGFIVMLFLTGLTGLLLMALRTTPLMGALLAAHLGVVFSLFLTMPYGKFVHGLYRFGALMRYAAERRIMLSSEAPA